MIDSETFDDGTKIPIVNVLHTPWADVEVVLPAGRLADQTIDEMSSHIDALSSLLWNQHCRLKRVRIGRA